MTMPKDTPLHVHGTVGEDGGLYRGYSGPDIKRLSLLSVRLRRTKPHSECGIIETSRCRVSSETYTQFALTHNTRTLHKVGSATWQTHTLYKGDPFFRNVIMFRGATRGDNFFHLRPRKSTSFAAPDFYELQILSGTVFRYLDQNFVKNPKI
jgi:hypothetical protein